jgi:hypothetical protein
MLTWVPSRCALAAVVEFVEESVLLADLRVVAVNAAMAS